jgi:nitrite reductase/ring-hydroxylating ferredoxin subunit
VVVPVDGSRVAVFWHEGQAWAVDNRCPHMGFPLSRGTVRDGLLTCHWHHARFDLASGGTLDPFAGDVRTFPTVIRDGVVFVDPRPEPDATARWWRRLEHGLEDQLSLALAKSTLALLAAGVEPREIVRVGARFGARYRAAGWGPGLSILTALGSILPTLAAEDRPVALFHGLLRVAQDCAGRPPRFDLEPLAAAGLGLPRLRAWFREAVEVRDEEGAERVLRTAIASDATPREVGDLLFAAATDHYYLDAGHTLDYIVKALELTDQLGWSEAPAILPSLVGGLCRAERSEERSAWRRPVDLPALLEPAFAELPALVKDGGPAGDRLDQRAFDALVETLLGDDPARTVEGLLAAIRDATPLGELGQAVAHAATLRVARFPTSNEFGDWDTVHNTHTAANALHQGLLRTPSAELARGLFHAAMRVYLDRFLNVPPARLPEAEPEPAAVDGPAALLDLLDREQQVTAAGRLVHAHLAGGHDERSLLETLGRAVLREDAGFHDYQALEAGFRQYGALRATRPVTARRAVVALARFVAAHCPTPRALRQTQQIALRLHRGEDLAAPIE